jgi:hypothetical protein
VLYPLSYEGVAADERHLHEGTGPQPTGGRPGGSPAQRTLDTTTNRTSKGSPMERTVDLSAADAFALISDFHLHERWIPLTTIEAPRPPLHSGDHVVAVSAGFFTDRMRVLEATPPDGATPGVVRVRKEGPVLLGDAAITVAPVGPDASTVLWEEDVWLAGPLPVRLTRALLAPAFAVMLAHALRNLERDAAALARVRDARRAS